MGTNTGLKKLERTLKELADIKFALDASAIVAITDQKGVIIYVNDTFCKVSKYAREELIGQNHRIINSGFHSKEFFRELWRTIGRGEVWKGEIKNKAKDGSHYWVDTTIVPFLNDKGKPYQYVSIRSEITQRKLMEDEIKVLPQRIIQAQEQECNRIARDIHDDLGQSLATLKIFIQSKVPQARILEYLDTIMEKSRSLAKKLRPSTLEVLGLTTALKLMFDEINQSKKLKVVFQTVPLDALRFKADSINLFRIIQEALTNVLKHAKATEVIVKISKAKGMLKITLKDNGKGFNVADKGTGLGLATMVERARLLGGELKISSKRKETIVDIEIPLEKV